MNCRSWLPVLLLAVGAPLWAADWFAGPAGNDANPGSPDQPLASIQAGVNKLRPGDTLFVRGGVYRETVVFPISGTAEKPIAVRAVPGEVVIVSGCDPLTGWVLHDAAKRIWKASMPWTLGLGRNQLFTGDRVLIEARFPNRPALGLEMYVADLSPLWPTFGEFSIPKETRVSRPGRVVSKLLEGQPDNFWKGAIYQGVHFEGWCAQTGIIESSKSGEIDVGDRTQGWWFGSAYDGKFPQDHEEGRGMIVGHFNALDQPGEWHWQDHTVYLIPADGGGPQDIEAKRRQVAFDLSDRSHIRIEGLNIRAASLRLENSVGCVVDRCQLAYLTHYTHQYNAGQIEKGRDTVKSGETGIYVSGRDNAFLNCGVRYSAGAGFYVRGYHHTIHNCLIDEIGYVGHYLNAITDAVGDFPNYENFLVGGHCVTFNTMRNAGRHFFNIYGNGTSLASRTRGPMDYAATLFAHNHLYNGMLLTRDAGFVTGYFCSGGTLNGRNTQIAYNVMHDYYDLSAMRWNKLGMVYLDEGTCNVDLHHNLLWAAPGSNQRDMWFNTCCVDIHEHDNAFHGLFTRCTSELRDEDFPNGKAFRFGHDFQNSPALPKWPQLEGETYPAERTHARSQGLTIQGDGIELEDGDWFSFSPVDFDRGWRSAVLAFRSEVRELNNDRSARQAPRHRKATDPLVLEAKYHDGAQEKLRSQWTFVYNVLDGAWVKFAQVPLGEGYRRFRAVYGNEGAEPWQVEVRLDGVDGPLVGQSPLARSDRERPGHVQIYREAVAELAPEATGTHDVYVLFRSASAKPAVDFEYLRFEQYRGELPLLKNEVKLELRAGSKDGPKLGEFYPRFTGGAMREFVTPLEPAQGNLPLFVVVRSALGKPAGWVESVRLEKSAEPVDWTGVGVEPLRAGEKWVFPEASNRPCATPADKYRQPVPNRPFYAVPKLTVAPDLDGKLPEWAAARALDLKFTPEGVVAEGPAPQAWAAMDDQGLYVALRCPVRNPAGLLPVASRRWGAADAVEIAIQQDDGKAKGPILTLRGWPDGSYRVPDVAGVPAELRGCLEQEVDYQAAVGVDSWTCEWRIPFQAAGLRPVPDVLPCNLTVRNAAEDAWRTWKADGGATYDLNNGGSLVLGAPDRLLTAELRGGLGVWLDAADAATIEKDAQGNVQAWKDRSGKGRHAVQAAVAYAPAYRATALDGLPGLQFDATRQTRFDLPDLADSPISATVFAVIANPEAGPPGHPNERIFTASDGKEYDYRCGLACGVTGTETGGPRLIVFEGVDRWAKSVRVGCFSPIYHTFFHGNIGEILVFARKLTPADKARVTAYLTAKWRL